MNKEYKKNIDELNQILKFLENNDSDLDTVNRQIERGLTKIQTCLDMLNESEGTIKIVTMKNKEFIFKNFDK